MSDQLKQLKKSAITTHGKWMNKLQSCFQDVGWRDLSMNDVNNVLRQKVKSMLKDTIWRKVWNGWLSQLQFKPKLALLNALMSWHPESRVVNVDVKNYEQF